MINDEMFLIEDFQRVNKKSMREALGETLVELSGKNDRIVVVTADLAESTKVDVFAKEFPDRFFDVGVAEQNMIGVAAGLALMDKIPVASSYSAFSPGRNFDQLRVSVCYSKANVKLVGTHAGLNVGEDGATHQMLEDMAMTRVLPNLVVISPCDYEQTKKAVEAMVEHQGPVYLRLPRYSSEMFTTRTTPFELGKAQVLKKGSDLGLIATGALVYQALLAAIEVEPKVEVEVVNVHTIKPIDKDAIIKLAQKCKKIIVVEEHQRVGGLGSLVLEVLADNNVSCKVVRMGVNDQFGESGEGGELLSKYGLDKNVIIKEIERLV